MARPVLDRQTDSGQRASVVGHGDAEALDAFSYIVGHDLKEPVRDIEINLGFVEKMASELPAAAAHHVAQAREANRRLAGLMAGLLEFSRASRTNLASVEAVHVSDALGGDACKRQFQDIAQERGARIEEEHLDAHVLATPQSLATILGHLVHNAIAHNPHDEPWVRVRTEQPDSQQVAVVVEDNGPGIPAHLVPQREAPGAAAGRLGLAIVRRTVERLGGDMWVESSPAGGAAVHVTFTAPPDRPYAHIWRASVDLHDHAACIYETRAELADALGAFLHEGLEDKECCIFIHSYPTGEEAEELLETAYPGARRLRDDRLVVVALYQDAFQGESPEIDYEHVQRVVSGLVQQAKESGLRGIRVFVDASRVYLDAHREEEWFAFESWLGHHLAADMALVCAYRRQDVCQPPLLRQMLETHAYRFVAPPKAPSA